jgi:hypothetical protein
MDPESGEEASALKSVHDLFPLIRSTIKRYGRHCINLTRIGGVHSLTHGTRSKAK